MAKRELIQDDKDRNIRVEVEYTDDGRKRLLLSMDMDVGIKVSASGKSIKVGGKKDTVHEGPYLFMAYLWKLKPAAFEAMKNKRERIKQRVHRRASDRARADKRRREKEGRSMSADERVKKERKSWSMYEGRDDEI